GERLARQQQQRHEQQLPHGAALLTRQCSRRGGGTEGKVSCCSTHHSGATPRGFSLTGGPTEYTIERLILSRRGDGGKSMRAVVLLALGTLFALAPAARATEDALTNPGFEDGSGGWTPNAH